MHQIYQYCKYNNINNKKSNPKFNIKKEILNIKSKL